MARITLNLSEQEKIALLSLAEREFRDPHAQAELIIHQELKRQGLITVPDPPAPSLPAAEQATPTKNTENDAGRSPGGENQ